MIKHSDFLKAASADFQYYRIEDEPIDIKIAFSHSPEVVTKKIVSDVSIKFNWRMLYPEGGESHAIRHLSDKAFHVMYGDITEEIAKLKYDMHYMSRDKIYERLNYIQRMING